MQNAKYKKIKWKDVLRSWKKGAVLKYPTSIKNSFKWNTSVLKNNGDIEYRESFQEDKNLPIIQDYKEFEQYFNTSTDDNVVSFPSKTKNTILVVPKPIIDKNYTTLKDFIDNASQKQQKAFWKKVAEVTKSSMKNHEKVWVSVHGFGVPYTHVRIETNPKYYFDDKLKKDE